MNEFSYAGIEECFKTLKLDMSVEELANLAQEERFNELQLASIKRVLEYLHQKKKQTTIETMLRFVLHLGAYLTKPAFIRYYKTY